MSIRSMRFLTGVTTAGVLGLTALYPAACAFAVMPEKGAASAPVAASSATAAPTAQSNASLDLADITRLSRQRVLDELRGQPAALPSAGMSAAPLGPIPPALLQAPVASPGTAPAPVHGKAAPKLRFTGIVRGPAGVSVMYMVNGTIYSAHVGDTLSNGWKLVAAAGSSVSVSSCGKAHRGGRCRMWQEPVTGDIHTVADSAAAGE
ncbi:hypothetical protein [Burkholderia cepacia]|uniref:hypothetical protein n=1 Tax=Burkholderia cepacia TaxID=292 RepID=UPI002ABD3343|nr:hypothetical protein [Burkholderia cepacia]